MTGDEEVIRRQISEVVESADDHDRAARDICQSVGELVEEGVDEHGHPVTLKMTADVRSQTTETATLGRTWRGVRNLDGKIQLCFAAIFVGTGLAVSWAAKEAASGNLEPTIFAVNVAALAGLNLWMLVQEGFSNDRTAGGTA